MEQITPPPQNILPEDIRSSAERSEAPKSNVVNNSLKKKIVATMVIVIVIIAASFFTLENTNLFKGSIIDLDYTSFPIVNDANIKLDSLFNTYLIADSNSPTQNKLIFKVTGSFGGSTTTTIGVAPNTLESAVTTSIGGSTDGGAVIGGSTVGGSVTGGVSSTPLVTSGDTEAVATPSIELTNPNAGLSLINVNPTIGTDGGAVAISETSGTTTNAANFNSIDSIENTGAVAPTKAVTSIANAVELKIVKYFVNITNSTQVGTKGQTGLDIEVTGNSNNLTLSNGIFSVNLDDYVANLPAGKYLVSLKQVNYTDQTTYVSKSATINIVGNETSYPGILDLSAHYDSSLGLQYRTNLNGNVKSANSTATLLKSMLNSATMTLSPADGEDVTLDLSTSTQEFALDAIDFPASDDNAIPNETLIANDIAGEYTVSVEYSFDFPESINVRLANDLGGNLRGIFVAKTSPEVTNISPSNTPGTSNPGGSTTCSDRFPANAISVSSADVDFGRVENNKSETRTITISRGSLAGIAPINAALRLDGSPARAINLPYELIVVLDNDSNPIRARIGDVALQENADDANATFDFDNPLTVTIEFNPTSSSDYENAILIYDPNVPSSCDPLGRIVLSGEGFRAGSSGGSSGGGSSSGGRRILGGGYVDNSLPPTNYIPAPGSYATYEEYLAATYRVAYVPPVGSTTSTAPAQTSATTGSTTLTQTNSGDESTANNGSMPIAETGPEILLYPFLLGASAVLSRKIRRG